MRVFQSLTYNLAKVFSGLAILGWGRIAAWHGQERKSYPRLRVFAMLLCAG